MSKLTDKTHALRSGKNNTGSATRRLKRAIERFEKKNKWKKNSTH